MFSIKKIFSTAFFTAVLAGSAFSLCADAADDYAVAHWKFAPQYATGSIESGEMTVSDQTGHGNTLEMRTYGTARNAEFSDVSLTGEGSIFLNGNLTDGAVDFVTVSGAPINTETFDNGYTIEILYKMPDDWTTADRWTSLISRLGSTSAIDTEGDSVTMSVHVSNCKEIQFIPANKKNVSTLSSDVWSVAMDKAENWYSIVITYDNNEFCSYINGCDSFRNITSADMQGLYADPADGRFRIGSRKKDGSPYRFTRGYIQEIRISDKALSREEWLVPNPEEYLGEYGDNSPFEETKDGNYNFVFLPDMQNAVKFKSSIVDTAMDWLVKNKDYANIAGVVSLGDNVQDFWETPQWENVVRSMSVLPKGGVKALVQPGNHDTNDGNNYWYYTKYFGPDSDYQKLISSYASCSSPSGTGYVFDARAGSFDYKIITIDMYKLTDAAETAWLRAQLKEHSQDPVIIVSHDIQNCSDTAPNETRLSSKGQQLWNIVKNYDNVFLMVGGHSHGYGTLTLENAFGHTVYSILADYQFSYNGGNALFKFAEFDEEQNQIHVRTFSPYVATLSDDEKTFFDVNFMTGKGHDDILPLNFEERLGTLMAYQYGENLLENPSFEESTDGWSANNNGTVKPISSSGWVRSSEYAYDGSYSLKQVGSGGKGTDVNLCTYIPIEAGKKYSLSYWEYSTVNVTSTWNRMSACAVVSDISPLGGGKEIMDCGGFSSWYNESQGASARDLTYSQGWTNRVYEFDTTLHPEAKYIMIAYAWGDANTFYIDDFSLREISLEEVTRPVIRSVTSEYVDGVVNVAIDYDISSAPDAKLLVAGINESGKLVCVKNVTASTAELTGEDIAEVKVFLWNGLSDIRPLCKSKVVTVERPYEP